MRADSREKGLNALRGLIDDIEVVVRWTERDQDGGVPRKRIETGQVGDEPSLFRFRRAPEGRPLDLTVSRVGPGAEPEVLHRQIAILTYGERTYTAVALKPSTSTPIAVALSSRLNSLKFATATAPEVGSTRRMSTPHSVVIVTSSFL